MKISLEGGGGSPDKIKSQHMRTKEEIEKAREEKKGVMVAQLQPHWLLYSHHRFLAGTAQTIQLVVFFFFLSVCSLCIKI